MVKVIVKMTIHEGMEEELKTILRPLVAETRKEQGCISYELFQDVNNKREFSFIEEWESAQALQQHMQSKHFKEAMPQLNKLQEKEMEVSVCTLVI
ncbi:putative quinol monooxygenase [Serpentinicella sp. ANB-PHB4]|uniref:putative quinol monooxygenase n=1 Tax=Serpentinicella sp. ANB-PHB4 TaxID=3074076 RepID=UPI002865E973|nr:putative quinol monooxygenase [Serpentinicella sp. ANB-PHB4]MDR5659501.1 putative quinol monooxygenase [Serpentinicella sp. ANB-PHB4]